MGMSYFASLYHVVDCESVRGVAPSAYQALESCIAKAAQAADITVEEVWHEVAKNEDQPWNDEQECEIRAALEALQAAFFAATRLELMLGQVGSDPLRGSDLADEWFWHVNALIRNPDCTAFEEGHQVRDCWVHDCG